MDTSCFVWFRRYSDGKKLDQKKHWNFSRITRELFCSYFIIKNYGLFPQPVKVLPLYFFSAFFTAMTSRPL